MRVASHVDGLVCVRCGQRHRHLRLRVGQCASCARCGANLRQPARVGSHALPAWALTALVLAVPAATLPVVKLSKFGRENSALLGSGVDGLIHDGHAPIAALVGMCAMAGPVALAGLLAAWWWVWEKRKNKCLAMRLHGSIRFLEYWVMPEVYVLGVLVAFIKLGELVHVSARPGLWCYAAMAGAVLIADRTFNLHYQTGTDGAAHNSK